MLTFPVPPMKATLGVLPADDDRWAYEIKYDGYRTLAFVDDGEVRLQSTNLRDVTDSYPELSELPTGVHAGSAVLDPAVTLNGFNMPFAMYGTLSSPAPKSRIA